MKNEEMALLFSEATPYIQKYHGKTMVIKYGGNAMINETLKNAVMNDLVTLTLLGVRVVLVHGGGPAINEMLKKVGVESHFAGGLRVTDDATMEIVQQVLAGKVNKDLVAKLRGRGVGLCGMDGQMLRCTELDPQLGHVGEIIHVDPTLISSLLDSGYIPVIATVGMDDLGQAYNVNADTAAAQIAIALKAEKLVSMTDIAGLLRDKEDESTLIPEVEASSFASCPRVSGVLSPAASSVEKAPSVTAVCTAVLEPAAEAGSTSTDTPMHTASSSARNRFFIVASLILGSPFGRAPALRRFKRTVSARGLSVIAQRFDGVQPGRTLCGQVAEQHTDAHRNAKGHSHRAKGR